MRINTNISAMNTWRQASVLEGQLSKSLERLSSGLRVNRASDDAAGLSISENLNAQFRGMQQAKKNVQDGLSLLRIADGGLGEIHALLQRMRELAVQAGNDTYATAGRQAMQDELTQLAAEIDRVAQTTTFNGIPLLMASTWSEADRQQLLTALQQSILKDGYDAVINAYGFAHQAVPDLPIFFDDDIPGGTVAYVRGSLGPLGNPGILELHLDLSWWIPTLQAGNIDALENVMAHEMVHAVMFDETLMSGFPTWFVEGTAEFAIGADSRVASSLASMGGDTPANRQALIDRLSNSGWGGTSDDYSAGYLATKYLDDRIRATAPGYPNGMRDVMANMLDNQANDLDDVVALAGYADRNAFLADFKANGVAWMAANVNLADADQGGIGGSDYGGPARTTATAVPTSGSAADPTPWNEIWPESATTEVIIQTGANEGQELTLSLTSVTSGSLGVGNLDLVNAAGAAIDSLDAAIAQVSSVRGTLGAQANQLEHTLANLGTAGENQAAAYSRIRDEDMAAGMTRLTRQQILFESAQSMLAQANLKHFDLLELVG